MPLNTWFDGGDENQTIPRERSFRVKRSYPKILRNRKRRIGRRLDPERGWSDQAEPIMKASNIHYEMAEKAKAVNCGGLGDPSDGQQTGAATRDRLPAASA